MWLLWYSTVLLSVLSTSAEFGTPNLANTLLCKPWTCVNSKLGLPMSLPPRSQYEIVLHSLLPNSWHDAVGKALDVCYGVKTRQYVNTCPGQALLHCTLDNLVENCPDEDLRKNDACYPIYTLSGLKYMFTQSRYQNLELNLPKERRPAWFMRQYFNTKCCNIPSFVNSTVLNECGFRTFLKYTDHEPKEDFTKRYFMSTQKPKLHNDDITHGPQHVAVDEKIDPLDCCEMNEFIAKSWRDDCEFKLSWNGTKRLTVGEKNLAHASTVSPDISTSKPGNMDVMFLPDTCEKENCVFRKLNIVSASGSVDLKAFSKLLDNLTDAHPSWIKAKARVITQCLSKKTSQVYTADCEINVILGCVLDVLSENCPHRSKHDECRNSTRNNTICQISSSKYRPKYRRTVCGIPNLVNSDVLSQCGVTSISKTVTITEVPARKLNDNWLTKYKCKDSSPSMICLMENMGILNKYKFMDYFRMKDSIRSFTSTNPEWFPFTDVYMNTFAGLPMYEGYCGSPKKLLNVLDAMLMTCPLSKRKNTPQCANLFNAMTIFSTGNEDAHKKSPGNIFNQISFQHIPYQPRPPKNYLHTVTYTVPNPIYNYGLLHSKDEPQVRTIDLQTTSKPPLVLLPVYMRTATIKPSKDVVSQSEPFLNAKMTLASFTELPIPL